MIKEHGGLTLAQAEFDHHALPGMPQSASATGQVDDVMAVEAMPARIIAYRDHMNGAAGRKDAESFRQDTGSQLATIMAALRARSGHDFSNYKDKTLLRRLQRRMQVLHLETPAAYIDHFRKQPDELDMLFRELLIGVTQFFRDPAAFEALASLVINPLLAGKGADDEIRIWVPGCASGQEAYTIAILVREAMEPLRGRPRVQIFGTDIDDRAIAAARLGRFKGPVAGVSAERLDRWFNAEGSDYCVIPEIREMCVFSTHSMIKHPPFSKLDLISCRNLLIYIDARMQDQVMQTFHYALKPAGALFLGSSESVTRVSRLFGTRDKKYRIFERRDVERASLPDMVGIGRQLDVGLAQVVPRPRKDDWIEKRARLVTEKFNPPHVVIDRADQVVRFSGAAIGQYLELPSGAPSFALFDILRKTLRSTVRTVLKEARNAGGVARHDNIPVRIDGRLRLVTIIGEALADSGGEPGCIVLVFQDAGGGKAGGIAVANGDSADAVKALEQELRTTRTQLQATIDELEVANEELKSSNEEHQSVNEELQSSNEELETAKEEMQSVNEEVQTINSEMTSKNDLLTGLNSDLKNLFESTEIATMFLDPNLRVKSFTPGITDIFHLRDADIGRPVTEIVSMLEYPNLQNDVKTVLRKLGVIERELSLKNAGASFILRIRPYRTVHNVIDGVVMTFVDVTERQAVDAALRRSELLYRNLFDGIDEGFCILEKIETDSGEASDFRFLVANPAFAVHTGIGDVVGKTIRTAFPEEGEAWYDSHDAVLRTGEAKRFERPLETGRLLELLAFRLGDDGCRQLGVIFSDVTARRSAEAALRQAEQQFHALAETIPQLAWIMDGAGGFTWVNRRWIDYTGTTLADIQGDHWYSLHDPAERIRVEARRQLSIDTGAIWEDSFPLRGRDGKYRWFLTRAEPVLDDAGKILRWFGTNTDIDELRRSEQQRSLLLQELDHRVKNLFAIIIGIVSLSARGATSPADLATTVRGRINALAVSHKLVRHSQGNGDDPAAVTTVRDLVEKTLAPYFDAGRIVIEGPETRIVGEAITNLALVLHELATNAAKYGALSVPDGHTNVSWAVVDARLTIRWRESGGPRLEGAPAHEGFGSMLARRSIADSLGGTLNFDWRPEGLFVEMSVMAERLLH
jgi:two-component system CheB/CheR fusion protein